MAIKRDSYGENEHSILYAETGGCCPLCTLPILFKKQGSKKNQKGYEVAHIYPLNPTKKQAEALLGYSPPDINALENVIALCPTCHTKYDKDFKKGELLKLRKIKDGYLSEAKAKQTASEHTIQKEVCEILDAITAFDVDETEALTPTNFEISTMDRKLKTGMSPLQKREIKNNAISFYVRIRDHIRALERQDQALVRILQNQINSYYLAMHQQNPENKDLIFNYVAQWISTRTDKPLLAAKVLTSFFVQNCEVFDVGAE